MSLNTKIKISEGKKNVARISMGTFIGQCISLISIPILTRIYGAEIIGIWTLFYSISTIINSFSDLGLTNSIMIQGDESNLENVYKVITTIVIFISIISGIIVAIYYYFMKSINLNIIFIAFFISIASFTLQQIQICYTWLNRKGEYGVLMKNPIINNITFSFIAIVLGMSGFKSYGYFIGWILGQIITLIHMKRFLPKGMFNFNLNKFKEIIYINKNFLKYQLPTNIISNFKNQIPTIGIKAFFGAEVLGYYSITVRIMQIPITLLASAIGRVFFQKASNMKRNGEKIGEFVYGNITKVMKIAIIPIICILVAGDLIIVIFLGQDWKMAGDFIRILSLQNFLTFLMLSVQGIAIVLDKQKFAMISAMFQSIGFIAGLAIGKYIFNNIYIGIILMTLSFIICNVTYFCFLFKYMGVSVKRYLCNIVSYVSLMLVIYLILRFILVNIGVVNVL